MGASRSHRGLGPVGLGAFGAVCCGAVEIKGVLGCWTLKIMVLFVEEPLG